MKTYVRDMVLTGWITLVYPVGVWLCKKGKCPHCGNICISEHNEYKVEVVANISFHYYHCDRCGQDMRVSGRNGLVTWQHLSFEIKS